MKTLRVIFVLAVLGTAGGFDECWGQAALSVTDAKTDADGVYRVKKSANAPTTITLTAPTGQVFANLEILTAGLDTTTAPSSSTPDSDTAEIKVASSDYDRLLSILYVLRQEPAPAAPQQPVMKRGQIEIRVDSKPPNFHLSAVEVFPGGSVDVTLEFSDIDIDVKKLTKDSFGLTLGGFDTQKKPVADPEFSLNNRFVKISYDRLNPGTYTLTVNDLSDLVDNKTTAASVTISIPEGALRGKLVEYPDFLPQGGESKSEFDPGDRVDTRVVQLYYLRDARQVAELINRNIQDLNAVGYGDAQRAAAIARKAAEDAIDDRRFQDERAVDAARRARETERKLAAAREALDQADRDSADLNRRKANLDNAALAMTGTKADSESITTKLNGNQSAITEKKNQIALHNTEIATLEDELLKAKQNPPANRNISAIQADIAAKTKLRDTEQAAVNVLQNQNAALSTIKAEIDNIEVGKAAITKRRESLNADTGANGLPAQLAREQEVEIAERQKVTKAEADELRASQEQFRREVAAGLADRNSFAAGKTSSIDPVAQCSISVVGTSRLHLRGPIKGLNKICRMIHQLDSPVGQVKIGIHAIQVNGEHGDRMDTVYEGINREIDHSRFLVNASGQLLRRAVQEVADEVALEADAGMLPENCPPELRIGPGGANGMLASSREVRDRRYLYCFYGSDFISELEEMDSELLNTENKLMSLHSMDTISLAGAMFVVANADHPVRQRIIVRFQELIAVELPQREMEYVRTLMQLTHCGNPLKYHQNQARKIDEREARAICFNAGRTYTFPNTSGFFINQIQSVGTLTPPQLATIKLAQGLKSYMVAEMEHRNLLVEQSLLETRKSEIEKDYEERYAALVRAEDAVQGSMARMGSEIETLTMELIDALSATSDLPGEESVLKTLKKQLMSHGKERLAQAVFTAVRVAIYDNHLIDRPEDFQSDVAVCITDDLGLLNDARAYLMPMFSDPKDWQDRLNRWSALRSQLSQFEDDLHRVQTELDKAKEKVLSKRMLLQFIDEQEEKSVNLMEALRSHASNVDNFIKRLAIAMEDDIEAQFYEPAFQRVRRVSRSWDVTLGQVESTTVLTNNRTLAKVSPAASFEFDLPKREILITEAMQGAKALSLEYGNLLNDPTFGSASELIKARTAQGVSGENAPYAVIPGLNNTPEFGTELEKLIEPPAIYKFETGTGFEIRPVIQPDGSSITYTFDYQYSTQVREPVRADEKHLGRIKRHFVHTEVQTGCYELREISRYTVALKAARTDRGVPFLQDIPGLGVAFRPLPSDESSLQTNIILGSSTVYPTIFDLMGLKWSAYVDGEGQSQLVEQKKNARERASQLRQRLLQTSRRAVDRAINLGPGHEDEAQ